MKTTKRKKKRKGLKYKFSICNFSKKIVISCIVFIVLYTIFQTFLSYKLGIELSPTLTTCVYAFFGTELAASAAIRIFTKEDKSIEESTKKIEDESNIKG